MTAENSNTDPSNRVMVDETNNFSSNSSAAIDFNDFIQTAVTNNYISRRAILDDSKSVEMKGRSIIYPEAHLRSNIRIGRYCQIQSRTILQPPAPKSLPACRTENNKDDSTNATTRNKMMTIGSHTMIGQNCMIEAAAIGSNCSIGDHVRIGANVIVKDNCIIASYTNIPPNTNIPPFTRCYCTQTPEIPNGNQYETLVPDGEGIEETNTLKSSPSSHIFGVKSQQQRRIRLITTSLPPAIVVELQENAVASFHAFVTEFRKNEIKST
jgi:dynactin 5